VHRASAYYFAALLLLAVPAFWPTYLFPPKYETDWHIHLHGAAMLAWMLLLVAQACLIAARRNDIHRVLGKVSYGLVPLMVVSTLLLAHYRLRNAINEELLYFLVVQLALTGLLALAYGLAMAHRKRPALHMRYMVCTSLTLVDPIVARILFHTTGTGFPAAQIVTYALTDAILAALAWRDWRGGQRQRVYLAMLAVFVAAQVPTFFLYKLPAWRRLAEWYAALSLP
jgi:hypothetical protein